MENHRELFVRIFRNASVSLALSFLSALSLHAQQSPKATGGGYFTDWFDRVDKTQAEQPRWITPVATTTPRLGEEFRYDIFWQTNNASITSENYGGAKGLELIPSRHIEVILVAPPAYIVHNNPALADGFGDWGFLVIGLFSPTKSTEITS